MTKPIGSKTTSVTPGKVSYGWVILVICTALVTLAYGLSQSYSVFFKPLASQYGWDRTTTSLFYSVSWLTRGVVAIAVGWASDKFGARAVLIVAGIFTCLGFVLSSQVHTLWQFFFTYGIVLAVGLSGSFGIGSSLVASWFRKKSALPLGIFSMSSGLGNILIVPIAAQLLISHTLSATFVVCGFAGGGLMVLGALFLRPAPKPENQAGEVAVTKATADQDQPGRDVTLREALRHSELYLLMCIFFVFVFSTQIVQIHLLNYATDLGVTPLKAAAIISMFGIVSIAGRLLTGILGDRINILTLLLIAPLFTVLAFIILIFSKSLLSLYFFAVIFGIAYGAEVPLTPMMAKKYFGTRAMATLVGVFQLAGGFGGFAGPLAAGKIFDVTHSYHLVFIMGSIVVALCLIPIAILKKRGMKQFPALKAIPTIGVV